MPSRVALAAALASGPIVLASTARVIAGLATGLVLVGVVLCVVAVRLVRTTRADHVALGPLEVLGDRSWRRHDADRRSHDLARARPTGAAVVDPGTVAAADPQQPVAGPVTVLPADVLAVDVSPAKEPDADVDAEAGAADDADADADADADDHADADVSDEQSEWAAPPAATSLAVDDANPLQPPPLPQPGPLEPSPVPPLPDPLPGPDPLPAPLPVPGPDPLPIPTPDPVPLPEPEPYPAPAPIPAPDPVPEPIPVPEPGPIPAVALASIENATDVDRADGGVVEASTDRVG